MQKAYKCGFTGYRPHKLPWKDDESSVPCRKFKELLHTVTLEMINDGFTHFISGFAAGIDLYAAEAVLSLKEEHPGLVLEAALPFRGQADAWPPAEKERFKRLLARCGKVTCLNEGYHKQCFRERNRYIVQNSDRLIAVCDGKPGGTMQTISFARKCGIEVILINPETLEIFVENALF